MLVYSSWFGDLGGGELRMLDHLQHSRIPRDRLAVLVQAKGELLNALATRGIHTLHVPWKRGEGWAARQAGWYLGMLRCAYRLWRMRPCVVVCNTFHDLETTGRVAAALGLPLVWRARADTFTITDTWPPQKLPELVHFLNGRVARILPTTRYEAELMIQAGVDARRIRVVHNGVDLSKYRDAEGGERIRSAMRIPSDERVIAFVARMVPQKGYEVLLAALAKLRASGYRFRALVAGDTTLLEGGGEDYRDSIKRMVQTLGLSDCVTLLGARKDVSAIMNAADMFVLASLKEPFGTTVIEAMAAGKPVICSDLPGPRESAIEGETAIFFPAGDASALAKAIGRLIDDPDTARELGRRGQLQAESRFSMQAYVQALDEECVALGA